MPARAFRSFPFLGGATGVVRAWRALSGRKPRGEELTELAAISLSEPIGSLGVLADYVAGRIQREVRPDRITRAHAALAPLASPVTDQVKRLRSGAAALPREHRRGIGERQFQQKRPAAAVSDIYAHVAG